MGVETTRSACSIPWKRHAGGPGAAGHAPRSAARHPRRVVSAALGYPGEEWGDCSSPASCPPEQPDDVGVSVSYPLPGTAFYERVESAARTRTNRSDSDDLAMMFEGTYGGDLYRKVRDPSRREALLLSGHEGRTSRRRSRRRVDDLEPRDRICSARPVVALVSLPRLVPGAGSRQLTEPARRCAPRTTRPFAGRPAFDALAPDFDRQFGAWASVVTRSGARCAASSSTRFRRCVAPGLGGTGEDASFRGRGRNVHLTDGARRWCGAQERRARLPRIVSPGRARGDRGARTSRTGGKERESLSFRLLLQLRRVQLRRRLAAAGRLSRASPCRAATRLLVVFGLFCPGEVPRAPLRGRPRLPSAASRSTPCPPASAGAPST
jgi:hypothetical protein